MLIVDDVDELVALNTALMEARYHADKVAGDVRGSMFLTRLHVRVVDEIIASLERAGRMREADEWRNWRRFENRKIERAEIVRHVRKYWWRLESDEQRREVVVNQMLPFEFTEEDVQRVIAAVASDAPVE